MTMIKFDPVRHFENMTRKMQNIAGEVEKGFVFEKGGFNPRVDITEYDNKVVVSAEVPGLAKEDVKVSVNEERILTIKGEKKKPEINEGESQIRIERSFGEFTRSFVLPEDIDLDDIKASFKNGLLELSLSKKEPEEPKEININIE